MSFGQRNLDRQKPEIEFPENGAPHRACGEGFN